MTPVSGSRQATGPSTYGSPASWATSGPPGCTNVISGIPPSSSTAGDITTVLYTVSASLSSASLQSYATRPDENVSDSRSTSPGTGTPASIDSEPLW